jgi:hypothetical protein
MVSDQPESLLIVPSSVSQLDRSRFFLSQAENVWQLGTAKRAMFSRSLIHVIIRQHRAVFLLVRRV